MRRLIGLLTALAMLTAMALMASVAQAAASDAAGPIENLNQALLQIMHEGKSVPFTQRYTEVAPAVEKAFDLPTILQTSVGPRWQTFTPAQQQDLQTEFLRFTVASYVSNFSSFGGEKFEVEPNLRAYGADQVVSTRIIPVHGDVARIDYVMRQGSAGWQAVDVLLDGTISRVAVQRSDFRSLLDGGPAALLDSLRKKVSDLSGGAPVP